ncbi:unnamed protein product, partial [Tilletia caries]
MEAFVQAFQDLSPTKRNTFVQAIMSTTGAGFSSVASRTPLVATATTAGATSTGVTAAATGPISASSDTAVAAVDGFNASGSSLLMSAPAPAPQPLAPGWPLTSGQAAGFPSDDALASAGFTGLATGHTSSA